MRLRALSAALTALSVLAVPTAASAAMGGANALTTSLRPDLRSATVQSTNQVDDTTTVRVCFSKAIASLPQAGLFRMGDYLDDDPADGLTATSATRSTSNCADAVFPSADATPNTFVTTFGSEGTAPDSGSSAVSSNGFGNIQDSTALIGSNTHNGTRGFGAGPDLVGITVNNAASTIDYTFDQRIALGTIGTGAFDFVANHPNGSEQPSLAGAGNRALSTDGLTVRVNFAPGSLNDVVRAFVDEGAVDARTGGESNELRSAARPGSGGFTDRPDLVAVLPAADGSYVDYQFDQVLTAIPGGLGDFQISRVTGGDLSPTAVSIVGGAGVGNTVRGVNADGTSQNESWVQGSVFEGAVTGAGGPNTAGGLPAGGNVGAFATGFTVAPEALTVSFDNATDIAHVLFDQRWQVADPTAIKLIDDQGSQIAGSAINVSGTGSPTAGKITADITFPPGTVAGARSLLLQFGAVEVDAAGGFGAFENRVQVISPTAPAATTTKKFRKMPTAKRRAAKRR